MSTRSRVSLTMLALLAMGAFALAAYAEEHNEINGQTNTAQSNAAQPNAAQQNAVQPNAAQQNAPQNAVQQNAAQTNAAQPQPYRVNMNPGVIEHGQLGQNGRQNVDLFLIPCLINANNGEVALANIALQHAQSSQVKDFAQQMIKDHTAGAKQFEELQTKLSGEMRPQSPTNTPVAAALFEVNQQIEQACLANAQRELEQLNGAEFDRAYIGMQIGMHSQLQSVVSVLKNHVTSPEFRKDLDETSQVVARHLEDAKKVMKDQQEQHGGNNSATSSR